MQQYLEVLQRYDFYGWLAFALVVLTTPIAAMIARKAGVMDMPDQFLKPHAKPTPYLGGMAILFGWTVALVWALSVGDLGWMPGGPILLGGIGLSIIGVVDDIRGLSPRLRLAAAALIVGTVLISSGAGIRLVDSVFLPPYNLPAYIAEPISLVICLFIVLGACNSTNLIDGLDGLCSGVTAIISLAFFLLASFLAMYGYSAEGDRTRMVMSIAMLGAALGFLPMNFNPARIFMGDAGSMLLGYNCGMLIVLFAERGVLRWFVAALMIFALPVLDTLLAIVRRWRAGKPIFEGDRSHFYDQLVQRGLSVRKAVLVCYGLASGFAAIGLLAMFIRTRYAVVLYVLVLIVAALAAHAAGLLRSRDQTRPRPVAGPVAVE